VVSIQWLNPTYWAANSSARRDRDHAHRWLRDLIAELLAAITGS
jgi:hypothetical protein